MSIPENMKVLPKAYWVLKMHKSLIRARFIIASKQSVIKPLSKNITAVSKLLYKSVEKFYNKNNFCFRVNSFWVIQNKKNPVTDTLN